MYVDKNIYSGHAINVCKASLRVAPNVSDGIIATTRARITQYKLHILCIMTEHFIMHTDSNLVLCIYR